MKALYLILILINILVLGCKNTSNKKANKDTPVDVFGSPTPTPEADITFFICKFNESIDQCNLNSYAKKKLLKLTFDDTLPIEFLDYNEVKKKYSLTDEQSTCLKEKFCKEEN